MRVQGAIYFVILMRSFATKESVLPMLVHYGRLKADPSPVAQGDFGIRLLEDLGTN
jgi:hypothetical protein